MWFFIFFLFLSLSLVGIPAWSSAFAAVGYGVSVHLVQHKHGKEDYFRQAARRKEERWLVVVFSAIDGYLYLIGVIHPQL